MNEHEHEHEHEPDLDPWNEGVIFGHLNSLGPFASTEEAMEAAGQIQKMVNEAMTQMRQDRLVQRLVVSFGDWIARTHPVEGDDEHAGLTEAEVADQHEAVMVLVENLEKSVGGKPSDEWSDGDKLRSLAMIFWSWQIDDGLCFHHDEVQQELLAMADRLDVLDLAERAVAKYDFDPDYQAGLMDEEE